MKSKLVTTALTVLLTICANSACMTSGKPRGGNASPSNMMRTDADYPAPVPPAIDSFFAHNKNISVALYRLDGPATSPSLPNFHGIKIKQVIELDPRRGTEFLKVLRSPRTYTTLEIGCLSSEGLGVALHCSHAQLDLILDVSCKHVLEAERRRELGYLNDSSQASLSKLIAEALAPR